MLPLSFFILCVPFLLFLGLFIFIIRHFFPGPRGCSTSARLKEWDPERIEEEVKDAVASRVLEPTLKRVIRREESSDSEH